MPNLERKLKIFADRTEMAAPSGADKADILGVSASLDLSALPVLSPVTSVCKLGRDSL